MDYKMRISYPVLSVTMQYHQMQSQILGEHEKHNTYFYMSERIPGMCGLMALTHICNNILRIKLQKVQGSKWQKWGIHFSICTNLNLSLALWFQASQFYYPYTELRNLTFLIFKTYGLCYYAESVLPFPLKDHDISKCFIIFWTTQTLKGKALNPIYRSEPLKKY